MRVIFLLGAIVIIFAFAAVAIHEYNAPAVAESNAQIASVNAMLEQTRLMTDTLNRQIALIERTVEAMAGFPRMLMWGAALVVLLLVAGFGLVLYTMDRQQRRVIEMIAPLLLQAGQRAPALPDYIDVDEGDPREQLLLEAGWIAAREYEVRQ
jgi:hypothetical protein